MEELNEKTGKKMVEVEFKTSNDPRKHGAPYIAVIEGLDEKYGFKRKFLGERVYGKKLVEVSFKGALEEGTIVEIRCASSWKNEYRYYAVVKENADYSDSKSIIKNLEVLGYFQNADDKLKVKELLSNKK